MKNFFTNKKKIINSSGFSLVEVLIASAIISLTSIALMSAATKGIELSNRALKQVQASQLIEEGVEAVKSIRDTNWDTISGLTPAINYYLSFDTNTNLWSLDTIQTDKIDGLFTRLIVFSDVNRDSNDDIAEIGTLDVGTKKVNVFVTWPAPGGINSKNLKFYLANIFN